MTDMSLPVTFETPCGIKVVSGIFYRKKYNKISLYKKSHTIL